MALADEVRARQAELGEDRQRSVRRSRRLGIAAGTVAVTLIMAAAVLDGFDVVDLIGVDERTVAASAGDIDLEVTYPSVTRPALASPFEIVVRDPDGFDGPVRLAVDAEYLMAWDVNGVVPAPSGEVSEGDLVVWEFDPPSGEVLHVRYEARIEPARQEAIDGSVALLREDDTAAASVSFRTRLRP